MDDVIEWAKWYETADRQLARDEFPDGTWISTVFLGLDHQYGDGPPVLWETMIFAGKSDLAGRFDESQLRYTSREDALRGHEKLRAELIAGLQVN